MFYMSRQPTVHAPTLGDTPFDYIDRVLTGWSWKEIIAKNLFGARVTFWNAADYGLIVERMYLRWKEHKADGVDPYSNEMATLISGDTGQSLETTREFLIEMEKKEITGVPVLKTPENYPKPPDIGATVNWVLIIATLGVGAYLLSQVRKTSSIFKPST